MKPEVGDLWEVKAVNGVRRCLILDKPYANQYGTCCEVLWLDYDFGNHKERIYEWNFQQMAWSKIA